MTMHGGEEHGGWPASGDAARGARGPSGPPTAWPASGPPTAWPDSPPTWAPGPAAAPPASGWAPGGLGAPGAAGAPGPMWAPPPPPPRPLPPGPPGPSARQWAVPAQPDRVSWGAPPPTPGRGRAILAVLGVVAVLAAIAVGVVVMDPMGVDDDRATAAGWRDDAAAEDLSPSTEVPARPSTTTTEPPAPTTTEPPSRLLPAPVAPPEPGVAAYIGLEDDGDPIAWDPCETIQYVVNPRRAPAGATEILAEAMAAVTAATGLVFEDRGTTDEPPSQPRPLRDAARYGEGWSPVLISWTDPEEWPALTEEEAIGFGGPSWVSTGGGEYENVAGEIQLDGAWSSEAVDAGWRSDVVHLVMHELGHLVGLDHVDVLGEVMYGGEDGELPTEWGVGDRTGLAAIGTGDCDPDV